MTNNTLSHPEVPDSIFSSGTPRGTADMSEIVGTKDILFLCYDTLRYDVAKKVEAEGGTPNINKFGAWEKCHAAGNFTYPSHHAMFAGFLPIPWENASMFETQRLFFAKDIGMGRRVPKGAYSFDGATIMEGLEKDGYETICVGGVGFFNKRTPINSVFPNMFTKSYWNPGFACGVKDSTEKQFAFAVKKLKELPPEKRAFLFINISSIHYPNSHYLPGAKNDSVETHAAALEYVDGCLPPLLDAFRKRGGAFVIACSDHGSCYGEDGKTFHGFNHEIVNTVPYMEFELE